MKEYSSMLEDIIVRIDDRMNNNKQELAKFIQMDLPKNNDSINFELKSQIMTSVVHLPEQESMYMIKSPIKPKRRYEKCSPVETLNNNTIIKSKKLDLTKLTPAYQHSGVKISRNDSSTAFIDEIKKLNMRYNKPACSLDNFSDLSPMVDPEPSHPKNSLNNDQFQAFVKVLADRIKDRYEENLNEKVFGN